jgi:hypothetical protein
MHRDFANTKRASKQTNSNYGLRIVDLKFQNNSIEKADNLNSDIKMPGKKG